MIIAAYSVTFSTFWNFKKFLKFLIFCVENEKFGWKCLLIFLLISCNYVKILSNNQQLTIISIHRAFSIFCWNLIPLYYLILLAFWTNVVVTLLTWVKTKAWTTIEIALADITAPWNWQTFRKSLIDVIHFMITFLIWVWPRVYCGSYDLTKGIVDVGFLFVSLLLFTLTCIIVIIFWIYELSWTQILFIPPRHQQVIHVFFWHQMHHHILL